jgi:glyoxylase-like metal-dependent hydrolase (beta-lactamase superfamily II)
MMTRLAAPRQLSPHLYIAYAEFPHRDSGNVYLVTGKHPTLIDCGSRRGVRYLVQNLAQIGLEPRDIEQVIATHGDCDHLQGYHELRRLHPGLKIRIHPRDLPLVLENDPYRNASYLYRNAFEPFLPEQCLPIEEGDLVPADDTHLMVLHTPGHTEGSLCLLGEIDGHKVLFAGDTFGGAMRSLEGAELATWVESARTWRRSLQKLAALDFDWVLDGHEPEASLPISRARFDRAVASFGKMLNPWFSLEEGDDTELSESAPVAEAG